MTKDKIKEIEQKYNMWSDDFNIDPQDVEWLIEQVKRVQKLEEHVEDYRVVNRELHERRRKLRKQNKRYREALEFYAEQDNYRWEISYRPQQEIDCMVIDDGGHTARKALKGE